VLHQGVRAVLLNLTVELGRLQCGLALVVAGVHGGGGGKVLMRASGRCLRSLCGRGAMTCNHCRAGFGDNP
jgi:hypothetical protein